MAGIRIGARARVSLALIFGLMAWGLPVSHAAAVPLPVSATTWHQNTAGVPGTNENGDRFSWALAWGDFNGDTNMDLAIGAPREDGVGTSDSGRVTVLYGTVSGLSASGAQVLDQSSPGMPGTDENDDQFGRSLGVGDFDGDGRDDLVISAHREGIGAIDAGAITVLMGSSTGLTTFGAKVFHQGTAGVPGGNENGDRFGRSLAVGDFDGDGADDVAITALQEGIGSATATGAVTVLYGILGIGMSAIGAQVFHQGTTGVPGGNETNDLFGLGLAAGDFDGDGRDDLAIGSPNEGIGAASQTGAVTVLSGTASGLTGSGAKVFHQNTPGVPGGNESSDKFGFTLATGDFDGDGRDDLAINALGEDIGGVSNVGTVTVLPGSASGVTAAGAKVFHQGTAGLPGANEAEDRFGLEGLSAADFDGDGNDDLAIGTSSEGIGAATETGAVTILSGSASGLTVAGVKVLHQDTVGFPGVNESGDEFGRTLAAVDGMLAIGAHREDVTAGVTDEGAFTEVRW